MPTYSPNNKIIETLFRFILDNNYFTFQDTLYRQKFGSAMGSRMCPAYATLFLGKLEEEKIMIEPYSSKILLYCRFLDDIFLLWKGNLEELNEFNTHINQIHDTIKFTIQHSEDMLDFLDTTIYIDRKSQTFKSKVYTKDTDAKPLLHYTSYHPQHMKENIVYTQALRYRTLTTDNKIFKEELKDLKETFINRGYPKELIERKFKKTKLMTQKDCLQKKKQRKSKHTHKRYTNSKNSKAYLPFIIEYYENLKPIKDILNRHWHLIKKDQTLSTIFPTRPQIINKRHRNLKQLLIRTPFITI